MCPVVNNRSGVWQWVVGQSYAYDLHRVDTDRRDDTHKPGSGIVALRCYSVGPVSVSR